jgi:hypothetical protein
MLEDQGVYGDLDTFWKGFADAIMAKWNAIY